MPGRFGPFRLERLLGRGGMAEAFLAVRPEQPAERLVVKRVRADFAYNPAYLKRLVLEAQVASRLAHPNLVRLREFGRVGDCHYIEMDQIRGHSLHRLVERSFDIGFQWSVEAALHLGMGMLEGLAAMHRVRDDDGHPRPMLHRDVTPANVIIGLNGDPVIIDFGIAKDVNGPSITLPGQVIGTMRYMAPEHRRCEYIDPRADVFSVSVVLFELLTGQHPWPPLVGMKELLRTSFDPPRISPEAAARIPPPVLDGVMKGLACAAEDRWADAEEMRAALAPYRAPVASGRAAVHGEIAHLDLPRDEELTTPVVDLMPEDDDEREVMWTADGVVLGLCPSERPDELEKLPTGNIAVLDIPPLPPRRDEGVSFEAAERAALRSPWAVPMAAAAAVLVAGVSAVWWLG